MVHLLVEVVVHTHHRPLKEPRTGFHYHMLGVVEVLDLLRRGLVSVLDYHNLHKRLEGVVRMIRMPEQGERDDHMIRNPHHHHRCHF
jgi:hypothetical protein